MLTNSSYRSALLRTSVLSGVAMMCLAVPALAQAGQDMETVTVTGYRASLEKALDVKRESVGVRDSIVAEDIGKFPATNIAESLQRVPGVALNRDSRSDEGKTVTVRGLNPGYTVVTINGLPVHAETTTSIGNNQRQVDLDLFGADLFSRVDFYKSPQANLNEGGIGGVVDLRTPHPFDYDGLKVNYGASYGMNSIRNVPLPGATVQVSNTWGAFGALFAMTFKESDYQLYGWEATGWSQSLNEEGQRQNALIYDLGPSRGGFDTRANIGSYSRANIEQAFVPRFARTHAENNKRTRLSGLASFQFRPNEKWDVSLDLIGAHIADDRDEYTMGMVIRSTSTTAAGWANCQNNQALRGTTGCSGLVPTNIVIDDYNNLYGTFANSQWLTESRWYEGQTKFASAELTAKYQATDDLSFNLVASMNGSNGFYSDNRAYTQARNITTTYDGRGSYKAPQLSTDKDLTNAALFDSPSNFDAQYLKEGNHVIVGMLSANYKVDTGLSLFGRVNVEGGLSYVSSQKTNDRIAGGGTLVRNTLFKWKGTTTTLNAMTYGQFADNHTPWTNLMDGLQDKTITQWAAVPRSLYEALDPIAVLRNNVATLRQPSNLFAVTEAVESAWLQADSTGELFGRSLRLNAGVRVAKTRLWGFNYLSTKDASNNTVYTKNPLHNSYDTFLPNVGLAYDVMDDLVFRASYGKTITRPALGQIAGALTIGSRFNAAASSGNPRLTPMMANNVDLGVEWYFQPESVLSFGVFYKGVKGLVSSRVSHVPFSSLPLPETALECSVWCDMTGHIPSNLDMTLTSYVNANPMVVKGFEVFYQQPFTFLPAPFDKLGALANFTYTAGSQSGSGTGFVANPGTIPGSISYRSPIPGLSNYTYSTTAYYETEGYNVRLSYNWRSKSEAGQGNYYQANWRMWTQARGTLDGTAGVDLMDNLELRFDVTNILNTNGDYQFLETAVPSDHPWNANYARAADPVHGDRSHIFYNYLHGRNYTISLRGHL